ncbi:MAG: hypothetical protein UZ09_BCD002001110 [Bacteroidetes bacterium OLB9]|nr:MAG: hypothetical protein UZ09_BCD002001110 [Bacteroidetes bacterium OLB9]
MFIKFIFNKGQLPLVLTLIIFSFNSLAQKSPFQLRIGYEQLYVSKGATDGIAEKTWTWHAPDGDIFQFRTSLTHAYQLGLGYDITNWWNVNLNFKKFYRRYYVWSGTYLQEKWEGNAPGQFKIVPYVGGWFSLPSMFLGTTLATTSWQLGTDFHHKISKNGKWHLHYYLSLNRDLYEVNLNEFDTPVYYEGNGAYFRIGDERRVDYTTKGNLTLRSNNPWTSQFRASTNIALAISKKMKNGMGLRFEFGLRNIRWIKDNLLEENHWEIDLNHQRSFKDPNDPDITHIYLDINAKHDFPLYLGGYYTNLSFTFRPFRSPRDKEDYVSPSKKIGKFFRKIF